MIRIIISNGLFYKINCIEPTGDEINDGENAHEMFSIDGDLFISQLWTIKESRKTFNLVYTTICNVCIEYVSLHLLLSL